MRIYLAGGTHSTWREDVKKALSDGDFAFLDPRENGGGELKAQAAWDLAAIRSSDVVLAYFEADNPSGVGTATEAGYATGLGIPVIVVNESPIKYIKFVEAVATIVEPSLESAVNRLRALQVVIDKGW